MSFFENLFASGESERSAPTDFRFATPGFELSVAQNGSQLATGLSRRGTFAQRAFDTRVPRVLGDLDTLRGTIRPGFSDLRASRLGQVEAARSRAVSNLKDSLSARRVAGSSFADSSIINAERTFAREASDVAAASFLEELAANQQALNQELAVLSSGIQREFAELGVATSVGTQLASLIQQGVQFEDQMAFNKQQMGAQLFSAILSSAVSGGAQGGVFGDPLPSPTFGSTAPSATRGGFGDFNSLDFSGGTAFR